MHSFQTATDLELTRRNEGALLKEKEKFLEQLEQKEKVMRQLQNENESLVFKVIRGILFLIITVATSSLRPLSTITDG